MDGIWKELKGMGIGRDQVEAGLEGKKGEARETIKDPSKTEKLINAALKICERLSHLPVIGPVFYDLPLACELIVDYVHGRYRDVPVATIITLTAAVIYLVCPLDLIPDIIPVVGQLDDAAVFGLAALAAHNDLTAYAEWKANQE